MFHGTARWNLALALPLRSQFRGSMTMSRRRRDRSVTTRNGILRHSPRGARRGTGLRRRDADRPRGGKPVVSVSVFCARGRCSGTEDAPLVLSRRVRSPDPTCTVPGLSANRCAAPD